MASGYVRPRLSVEYLGSGYGTSSSGGVNWVNMPTGDSNKDRTVFAVIGSRISNGGLLQSPATTILGQPAIIDAQSTPHAATAIIRRYLSAGEPSNGTVYGKWPSNNWEATCSMFVAYAPVIMLRHAFILNNGSYTVNIDPSGADFLLASAADSDNADSTFTWSLPFEVGYSASWNYLNASSAKAGPVSGASLSVTATPAIVGTSWESTLVAAYREA